MANPLVFEDIGTPLIDSPSPFTRSESVVSLFPNQSDASSLGEQASQPVIIDDLIRGEDYVDQSLLYSKTPRRSWIYNHGM
jgi:hypothetical protein